MFFSEEYLVGGEGGEEASGEGWSCSRDAVIFEGGCALTGNDEIGLDRLPFG